MVKKFLGTWEAAPVLEFEVSILVEMKASFSWRDLAAWNWVDANI